MSKFGFCGLGVALGCGLVAVDSAACTGMVAGRDATASGWVIAAHNEDNSSPHFVRHALLPAGTTAWYEEPGRAVLPPPVKSFACFWSEVKSPDGNPQPGDLFFNEKGVLVYSNNGGVCAKWGDATWVLPAEGEASTLTDGGLGHNLRFAVARQATSAREGVSIMTNLISRYGYANRSRMFTIADKDEAWHVQVVQGRRFVARRCPDGAMAAYPNALTIERVEPGDLFSANLRPGAPFIAAYQGPRTWKSDYNFYRWREVYRLVAGVEPERGEACSFSLVPRQKVEAQTIKRALSSHFEGEACAPVSKHLPDENPDRKPTVCRRTTIESSICIFGATPEETVLLLATGRPCETAYFAAKPFGGVLPPDTVTGDAAVRRLREHQLPARKAGTRAAWTSEDISCAVGDLIAGYGTNDVSVGQLDALTLGALAVDDGTNRVLLMSFDLLGLDPVFIRRIRSDAAKALSVPEANVLLSCTHTHGGPSTRTFGLLKDDAVVDEKYLAALFRKVAAAVRRLADEAAWREVRIGFHSVMVDENRNRRFTTADNHASFIPHRRALHRLCDGIADKELGTLALLDPQTLDPLYVVGNYAAHPLASHAPGRGGLRITADFPGFYRRYLKEELGAEGMFVQGAAGDIVPKDDELGNAAARRVGERLAMESIASVIDIQRNATRFIMRDPKVGGDLRSFTTRLRSPWRRDLGKDEETLEIQSVAIGDVAFVGVPGELVSELGLEIKWHSPFRRTFIAYCSTAYFGYIAPANFVAAGGLESIEQRFLVRDVLRMLCVTADGLSDLRARIFPEDTHGGERYPDWVERPLVDLPGGVKEND